MHDFVRVHGGGGAEIDGRTVQVKRGDRELQPGRFAQLVDGGATSLEVGDHLDGDLRRIGGNAFCGDTVISGKDENVRRYHGWRVFTLPSGKPVGEFFKPPERSSRFSELCLTRRRRLPHFCIGCRQIPNCLFQPVHVPFFLVARLSSVR